MTNCCITLVTANTAAMVRRVSFQRGGPGSAGRVKKLSRPKHGRSAPRRPSRPAGRASGGARRALPAGERLVVGEAVDEVVLAAALAGSQQRRAEVAGVRGRLRQRVVGPTFERLPPVRAHHAGDRDGDRLGRGHGGLLGTPRGRMRVVIGTAGPAYGRRGRFPPVGGSPPAPWAGAGAGGDDGSVPEGDTVWLAAQRMNTALAGATLRRGELRVPQLADRRPRRARRCRGRAPRQAHAHPLRRRPDAAHPLPDGRQLAHLPARHEVARRPRLRRPGGPGDRDWECVGYRLHDMALVRTADEDQLVGHLGPDVLGPDWDLDEALRRLRGPPTSRSASRCSISATSPASATSTRSSRCS